MPEIEYRVFNVPTTGRNVAASRIPRLQPSVPDEFADMLSRDVQAGQWTVDVENGEPLRADGKSIIEYLEFMLATRPHWLMPEALADPADDTWTSGNLTLQGARLTHLEKYCGSKAAALVMLTEEAAQYGVRPFTTEKGVKKGDGDGKKPDAASAKDLSTNPWSANFKGDAAAREAKIKSILKQGTCFAEGLARSAGTTVLRPLSK
jgi:hypothetical protein